MNLCDENIDVKQVKMLRSSGLRIRQIGPDVAPKGTLDSEIIPKLHHIKHVTSFTRDRWFYRRQLSHPRYCIVFLDALSEDTASLVARFLGMDGFRAHADRMGKVFRIGHFGLRFWQFKDQREHRIDW